MKCHDLREIADSYLSDELMIETNHDVLKHLETCADCRGELAAREQVRAKLRAAFQQAQDLQMSNEFAARLRAQLRAAASQSTIFDRFKRPHVWLAVAACLLAVALIGSVVVRQHALTGETNAANSAVNLAMAELAENAVGDHRNCAVAFRLPKPPVPLEESGRKYDRVYFNLDEAVLAGRAAADGDVELIKAHTCVFDGRRYGHVILKYHGRPVSMLVTDLEHPTDKAAQAVETKSGANELVVAACPQVGDYQVSYFKTARHAIFVVSDLNAAENLSIARALAPPVYQHVTRSENVA